MLLVEQVILRYGEFSIALDPMLFASDSLVCHGSTLALNECIREARETIRYLADLRIDVRDELFAKVVILLI